MKKVILRSVLFLAIGLLILSCKKDPYSNPDSVIVTQIATASKYSVILKSDGTVWQSPGRTGGNTFEQIATDVIAISCGTSNTYIIKEDNTLWVRGWNVYGQLGLGTITEDEAEFVRAATNVKAVSASGEFALIIKNDNSL
mgnify:FL=1